MKRNLLSNSIAAGLMAETLRTAIEAKPPQLSDAPGDRRIHLMPEVSHAEREASLVLPRKAAHRDLARILQSDLDRELGIALGAALGVEVTDPAQLQGHTFERVTIEGEEGESFLLDGRRILWVGPVVTHDDGEQVTVDRPIRRIKAATEEP